MEDIVLVNKNKRFYFEWVAEVIFHPRRAFQHISSSTTSTWLTPLLLLSCLVLINTLVAGRLNNQAAMLGEISYPPDYQYYTPEQQAQYTQSLQSPQGPVFVYVLPGIASLIGVWIGWLILGGILHLIATMLGGRGSTATSMNIVAWGSIPLAFRALVQFLFMLITKNLISSPGLSGFSPTGDSGWLLYVSQFMKLIDIYVVWQIILIIIGIRVSTAISAAKSSIGVLLTVVIILALQAGLFYLAGLLGNL